MRRTTIRAAAAMAAATVLAAAPAAAQHGGHAHGEHAHGEHAHGEHMTMPTAGLRAELIRDIDQLERKFLGLADAMTGKYDWRPGEGVRSVSEVFMHVAGANFMIPAFAGVQPPEQYRAASPQETMAKLRALEQVTDEATVKETLRHAFMHARHAVAAIPDEQLDDLVKMFGQDATKRNVLTTLVTHMHEHLGQSIAYARTNGVVPPWSAGES
ncbi:MAG TPA: DinB family protein [Longimicrobiales bacterium]